MSRRAAAAAAAVAMGGLLVSWAAATSATMGGPDTLELLAWATGSAVVGGVALALLVARLGTRSVVVQLTVLATGTAAIVALGAWLGARAMFYSAHDLSALAVLLSAAGAAGAVVAILVGDRTARATEALASAAHAFGNGGLDPATSGGANAELARLARELDDASRRLADARRRQHLVEQSRRELVAWVSHDLRTPLAGMRAITEALQDGVVDDPSVVDRYHRTLREQVDQLTSLVDDLFELSRAQAGAIQLELEQLSLADVVSDAVAGLAPLAASKGVRLEGRFESNGCDLRASAAELSRALRNILENAVRHTPADGAVVVELGRDGDGAFVSIADGGGGVPEDHLPRIFDPGFHGDPARSPGAGGGFGLAIARSFVEAHRGTITVENEPPGARFTVWLPLDPTG